ncbi:MAG: DNA recombination protein RmuC [Ruminococcaceae bacterium]|nr:DNA recombination protein RmuC [Oscillospiraceae bacterium]
MEYVLLLLSVVIVVLLIVLLTGRNNQNDFSTLRMELTNQLKNMSDMLSESQKQSAEHQDARIKDLNNRFESFQKDVSERLKSSEERLNQFSLNNEKKLEQIRETVENKLTHMQEDNNKKLEKMRETVDEKLQKTLEDRIGKSFQLVSERLEEVYKGLGEMKTLASGVGDLKKVLSNVKTRGILGEIQLGAILEQMFSPDQYETNVAVKKGSANVVEFAIRLPGDGTEPLYLPIDAKFPVDAYTQLTDAYDSGDTAQIETAKTALDRRIKQFAKDISEKYISPPETTDFAIMFLPVEGLYAEVVRHGMVEVLQRDYKVNIAGPTTICAFLQSLQMGFKTLAIQKRSGEVWNVLGAVKSEFQKFSDVIKSAQQRLDQAHGELEKLVGVRTRAIQRKLNSVSSLSEEETKKILPDVPELLESGDE